MALRAKKIWTDDVDRREVGYYSTPDFVGKFIHAELKRLNPDGKKVLDPCVGKGEMARYFHESGHEVLAYDVIDFASPFTTEFRNEDFVEAVLRSNENPLFSQLTFDVDYIIANPPYNCHEIPYIRQNKARIRELYGNDASLNIYALFLRIIIDIAKPGTHIGIIVSDSFATASGYADLRRFILETCAVRGVHLCPTDLFRDQKADVRTCVMLLEKGGSPDQTAVSARPLSKNIFLQILERREFAALDQNKIYLADNRDNCEFVFDVNEELLSLFANQRLSDVAVCFTGISTGSDALHLRKDPTDGYSVPFYKNPGSRKFYAEPDAYICDDFLEKSALISNFMVRNKSLIPQAGLTCSSMGVKFSAAIRPSNSACGVNPNIVVADEDKYWLLAYLNSSLCLYLIRSVMIRGNMITPGYLQRLPIPKFDTGTKERLGEISLLAFEKRRSGLDIDFEIQKIDEIIYSGLKLSSNAVASIKTFCQDPVKFS